MDKEKYDSWMISPEVWKEKASVTNFMEDEIKKGLRDANGDPLPATINEFFLDLLFQRVKPRKGGKFMPSAQDCIRKQYTELLPGLLLIAQANRSLLLEKKTDTIKSILQGMTGVSEELRGDLLILLEGMTGTKEELRKRSINPNLFNDAFCR